MTDKIGFQTPPRCNEKENLPQRLLSIPPSPFLERLGYGTGVTVWKLQPSPKNNCVQSPWAIKNIRNNINKQLCSKYESLISNEANILKTLDHENIVGYRGLLKSQDGRHCLAMENGGESLADLIEARNENDLGPYPAETILKVALSIAKALKYLHEEKRLLHGDLKPPNIVVKKDFDEVKLCDFGVSLSLDDKKIAEKYVGTPIYSAPECQEGVGGPVTSKSDIFSLGLVLWEMISLFPPHVQDLFEDSSFENSQNVSQIADLETSGLSNLSENYEDRFGTRPPLPSIELGPKYTPVLEIFYCCTEQEPNKRPTAALLVDYLEYLTKS